MITLFLLCLENSILNPKNNLQTKAEKLLQKRKKICSFSTSLLITTTTFSSISVEDLYNNFYKEVIFKSFLAHSQ
jgi:hypothetical protein